MGGCRLIDKGTTNKNSDCLWLILNILSIMVKQGGKKHIKQQLLPSKFIKKNTHFSKSRKLTRLPFKFGVRRILKVKLEEEEFCNCFML